MLKVGSEVSSKGWGVLTLGLVGMAFALLPSLAHAGGVPEGGSAAKPHAAPGFVENKGQWDAKARYHGAGPGVSLWLEDRGVVLDYARPKQSKSPYLGHAIEMRFVGAQTGSFEGVDRRGTTQILHGKRSGISAKYGRIEHKSVYRGIDFVSYFDGNTPRYDFIVAPNANPAAIRLGFAGAKGVRIEDAKTLALGTVFGEQKISGLFAYQTVGGKKKSVDVRFVKNANGEVTFGLGAYDKSRELVIDPLVYGTYFGGNEGFDEVRALGSDQTGGTYVAGYTLSFQFPRNQGPYGFNRRAGSDAFLSKLQGDAYANDYSVYIGGDGNDQVNYLAVDASGNVFLQGFTDSSDFPGSTSTTAGTGRQFILRFAPTSGTVLTPFADGNGNGTIDGTEAIDSNTVVYRFGNDVDGDEAVNHLVGFAIPRPQGAAASDATRITLAGESNGTVLENVDAADNGFANGAGNGELSNSFYTTLTYSKSAKTFTVDQSASGYIVSRATGNDPIFTYVTGVNVDTTGNIYLSGGLFAVTSSDTALANPVFDTTSGVYADGRLQRASDIFVRKLTPAGRVIYSTLLGGSADDFVGGAYTLRNYDSASQTFAVDYRGPTIAADPNGNAYVLGEPQSFDFPRTRNVFGPVFPAARSATSVTKISASGDEILYSTNLGAGGASESIGISVDPRGQAYVTGHVTRLMTFTAPRADPPVPSGQSQIGSIPTTSDAIRPTYTSPASPEIRTDDGYFLVLNADATALVYGTYVGGDLDDMVMAPYTDAFGDTFIYGWTDTRREYSITNAARTTTTNYFTSANLGGFITQGAFKQFPETTAQGAFSNESNVGFGAALGPGSTDQPNATASGPFFVPRQSGTPRGGTIGYLRDGFILRYRLGLPLISTLTVNPTAIPGGDASGNGTPASTTATLTLSAPAPAGGAAITVTIDNGSIASFNPSSSVTTTTLTIAEGQTTVTFPVYSYPVTDVQNVNIRADYAGNIRVVTLAVRPWLQSLSVSTQTTIGGSGEAGPPSTLPTGTVRLEAPAQGDTRVTLSANSPIVRFPDSAGQLLTTGEVIVPNGQQTATFTYQTLATDTVASAQVRATLLGVTRTQNITVTPARLNRIQFNPNPIAGGSTATGTVFLDGRAASDRIIKITILNVATNSGYSLGGSSATNPLETTITLLSVRNTAFSDRASFTFTAGYEGANVTRTVRAVQVDAQGNEISTPVTGTILVTAQGITSVAISPTPVESGGTARVTVTLDQPAPAGGVNVTLTTQSPSLFPIGGTINFPEGTSVRTFDIVAGANTSSAAISVNVTAFRGSATNGTARVGTVVINPVTYSIALTPTTVFGGNTATGTITLTQAQTSALTFNVAAPSGSGVTVNPTTVTIPAGSVTGTFSVTTTEVTSNQTVPVTIQLVNSAGRGSAQAAKTLNVTVRAVQVSSLSLSRAIIRSGETTRLTVTLDGAVSRDTTISLAYSNGTLISFPPIVIRAGQSSATVTSSPASRVARTLTTSITAGFGGGTASTTLTVQR